MKEIEDISGRIEHGASVSEVNSAYEAHEFPQLERRESQMAIVKAVERIGKSALVSQVLADECAGKEVADLTDVGFKALMTTLSNETYKTQEIITNFQPDDLVPEVADEKYAQLLDQCREFASTEVTISLSLSLITT